MAFERWLYVVRLRLRTLFRRDRVEDDLGDEFRYHLDARAQQFVAGGMSKRDARDAALRAFGGVEQRKEEVRDARRMGLVEDFVKDVRYALRTMRRAPAFTAVAIVSLTLGIGANTAIFSAIDAVMFRRLPIAEPDRLLQLDWTAPDFPQPFARSLEGGRRRVGVGFGGGTDVFPYPMFTALRSRSEVFSSVFAFSGDASGANIGIGRAAESARVLGVSSNYFSGTGVPAVVGRTFTEDDDREQAEVVAVASYGFWQSKLGGTPTAVGQHITMNGKPVTIVGVAAQGFFGLEPGLPVDLWIPLTHYAHQRPRRNVSSSGPAAMMLVPFLADTTIWWTRIAGRLNPGASPEAARAEAAVTFNQSIGAAGRTPVEPNTPVLGVKNLGRGIDSLREAYAPSLLLLMGMVGLVLLIACANLAGLLLERASAREREIAVRLSLGVSRSRLVRQLLTESVTLAGLGGLGALAATAWTYPAVMSLLANGPLPSHLGFAADWRIVAFTAGISILAGVVFGLAPAVRASRVQLLGSLTQRVAIGSGGRGLTTGKILVGAQIALSLVLLVGAGLFARSLQQLHATELGFNRHNLLLFTVQPGQNGYDSARLQAYFDDLLRRVASTPGVTSATLSRRPAVGGGAGSSSGRLSGANTADAVTVHRHEVGAQYFRTLGIPIVRGRVIDERDTLTSARVLSVNETLVRSYFGSRDPIGQTLDFGTPEAPQLYTIVGVVKDVKYMSVRDEIPPTVYMSHLQFFGVSPAITFIVRTTAAPELLIPTMRREAAAADPHVPLTNVRTQGEAIEGTLATERMFATFTASLGVLALVLACVGLYGTMAYTVARRTNEIGVRIALGASRQGVLTMILRESLLIVMLGAAVGLPSAIAVARLIASRLYGVTPTDAITLGGATAVLVLVAITSAALPALRAAKLDPLTALRCD